MNLPAHQYSTDSTKIESHPQEHSFSCAFFFHPFSSVTDQFICVAFLIYIHPSAFEGVDPHTKNLRMLSIILFTVFFPALVCFLPGDLKLIKNLALENRQDGW